MVPHMVPFFHIARFRVAEILLDEHTSLRRKHVDGTVPAGMGSSGCWVRLLAFHRGAGTTVPGSDARSPVGSVRSLLVRPGSPRS